MRRTREVDEAKIAISEPDDHAAGIPGVAVALKRSVQKMGPRRSARTLLNLNQAEGFDCMSCAWPDPDPGHRHTAEFCENGAKAVAEEATTARATPEFFARHSIADLDQHSEHWLGQQGRITHPMIKKPGATHYEPIEWDAAFRLIADQLNGLASPDEAIFYTSGRTSNEAAFCYQLFVRAYGTNNLPDCSNMCHESTSVALAETIGIGKASVTLRRCPRRAAVDLGRSESRDQPPADAVRSGDGQAARRQDHCGQPAARGGPDQLPQSADAARAASATAPILPTCTCRSRSMVIWPSSRRGVRCWCSGTLLIMSSSSGTHPGFDGWRAHVSAIDWDLVRRLPACPASRSPRRLSCSATPIGRCSAGPWA